MSQVEKEQQVITQADTTTLDDLFGGDIPGVDENAVVEGGVDAAAEDDNCAGGACKI
ncbi:hypothetical protein PARSHIK_246 [Erwinia phage vB_EamM_Parshik]|nr:hypothetical protein PARSHIK_246 [Erwinia phage vB_EamM_Parshik]